MLQTKTPIHKVLRRLQEPVVVEEGVRSAADCARIELHRKKPVVYALGYLLLRSEGVFISESVVKKAAGSGDQAPTPEEKAKAAESIANKNSDEPLKVWKFDPEVMAKRIGGFGICKDDYETFAKNLPSELKDDLTMAKFIFNDNDIVLPALTPEAAQAVRDSPPADLVEAEYYLRHYAELEAREAIKSAAEQHRTHAA